MAQSYANIMGSGSRQGGPILSFDDVSWAAGNMEFMLDGVTGGVTNCFWSSGNDIQWDFGEPVIIDEIKFYQQNTTTHGVWQACGCATIGGTYTNIGSTFTLGGSATQSITTLNGNTTAYRYYSLVRQSGALSGGPWLYEFEFKINDVAAANQTSPGTYYQAFGYGDRTAAITTTTTATLSQGTINNIVDGANLYNKNSTDAILFTTGQSGKEIKFDFGSGNSPIVTGMIWVFGANDNHGTWKVAGSANDSSYTDITTGIAFGSSVAHTANCSSQDIDMSSNTTGYRYYKMIQTAGTTSAAQFVNEVLFRVKVSSDQSLTAGLMTNTQTFYVPTVSAGAATLTPGLFTNTNTFYAPSVAPTIRPGLFTNDQTFYGPTVAPGAATLTPGVLTNASIFYSPTIVGGDTTILPGLFTNTNTFYAPTVTVNQIILPGLFTNTNTFYAPSVTPDAATLLAGLLVNTNVFFRPTVPEGVIVSGSPVSQSFLLAVGGTVDGEPRSSQFVLLASYGPPVVKFTNATQDILLAAVGSADTNVTTRVSQGLSLVAYGTGTPGLPKTNAWTFVLDGHRFYVCPLGEEGDWAYDTTTHEWCQLQSLGLPGLNFTHGVMWGLRVMGGDALYTYLYELDPTQPLDEETREVQHMVTGGIASRSRAAIGVANFTLTASVGDDSSLAYAISLAFSDDNGKTWSPEFEIPLTDVGTQQLIWNALGSFHAPGRVFRLTDYSGPIRIDGADAVLTVGTGADSGIDQQ